RAPPRVRPRAPGRRPGPPPRPPAAGRAGPARSSDDRAPGVRAAALEAKRHAPTLPDPGGKKRRAAGPGRPCRSRWLTIDPRSVPARLAQLLLLVGTERHHLPPTPRLRSRLPHAQAPAQVVRVEVEHVADVLEPVEPAPIDVVEPLFRLEEGLLPTGFVGARLLAVDVHGVLEDRDHQPALPVVLSPPPDPVEILRREERVGLKQPGHPVL